MADRETELKVIRMADQLVAQHNIPRDKALRTAAEQLGVSLERTPAEVEAHDARLEKAIELAGDRQMRALGFSVIKFSHPGKTKQTPGIADRRYYHPGRGVAFWWEAKSPTGRQRPDQKDFQALCDAVGDPYVLGTDQDLFAWLIAQGIAFEEGGLLVPLPYTPKEKSA